MGKDSKISWTHNTFNIVWGCEKVSPACDNCYAEELDNRYFGAENHWGDNPRKLMADRYWRQPIRWNKEAEAAGVPQLVFCSSMADVFEKNDIVESQRPRLWQLIYETPHLRWLLLTKRPQNIKRMLPRGLWGFPTLWLGTTIENDKYLWRADKVAEVDAAVHFLSIEPLLGELALRDSAAVKSGGIDWMITGCESGKHSRPTPLDWYRRLLNDAGELGMKRFLKQAPHVPGVTIGKGSSLKFNRECAHPETGALMRGIVEQPYLDRQQWVEYPN